VEAARRKQRLKHGGGRTRQGYVAEFALLQRPDWLLSVDEALDRLAQASPHGAELVKLRYFAGFTNAETANVLGISARKANQVWAYARAWLRAEIGDHGEV
jgi:DNA-directed RNA polymerase specialized sigma24 family protein